MSIMICYCDQIVKGVLTDADSTEEAAYQLLYTKYDNREEFSMNFYNKLTNKYQKVRNNSKLWKLGINFGRQRWDEIVKQNKMLHKTLFNKK